VGVDLHGPDTGACAHIQDAPEIVSYWGFVELVSQHHRQPMVGDIKCFNVLVVIGGPRSCVSDRIRP
jgi:hypothetical protein